MKDENSLLLERAKQLAGKKDVERQEHGEMISVIEFVLSPENYAVEGVYVTEVLALKDITSIPGTPAFVMGVINLRGRVLSILNLKTLFKLKERGLTELNKIIILKSDRMEFGIVADSIVGTKMLARSSVSPPPLTLDTIGHEFITGVTQDGIILLNAMNLLTSKKIQLNHSY